MESIVSLVEAAEKRIRQHLVTTPLEYAPTLSERVEAEVYLKLESVQVTGSFKARGALSKISSLPPSELAKGIVTASTGNHAAAVAYALSQLGGKGTIWMPENVSEAKKQALAHYQGVELAFYGTDSVETERKALQEAQTQQKEYISPYNDWEIIGGQGTTGLEILQQLSETDAICVPIGGGGLIAGIAGYAKAKKSSIEITGCQPRNSAVMYHSVKAGKILDMPSLPTLSDGTAGGVETDAITFEICRQKVDRFALLSEEEIKQAWLILLKEQHLLVEGAAALSVAALLQQPKRWQGKRVVLIICGRKMPFNTLQKLICERE